VRRVPAASSRLKEASALGFRLVHLPAGNAGEASAFPDLEARPVQRVADFLESFARAR
jgi:predicted ATP-dependent serine protease